MKKELDFIISVIQGKIGDVSTIDWYNVVGFTELNKVSGYFYNRFKELGGKMPDNVNKKYKQIMYIQKNRNKLMRKYIQILIDELNRYKIPYAFLKGGVMSNANFNFCEQAFKCQMPTENRRNNYAIERKKTFYKEGERISNDIDILIDPAHISLMTKVLKELGFVQGYFDYNRNSIVELDRQEIINRRMNRGETAPFLKKINNSVLPFIEIDINFSLSYFPIENDSLRTKMLEGCVDYIGSIPYGIRSLEVNDFFLYLIMHQYKESILYSMAERNKTTELYKYLDIYLFIERGFIDLYDIINLAFTYKVTKEVYFVLYTISQIFTGLKINDVLERIKPCERGYLHEVFDPVTGKKYAWEISIYDRVLVSDKIKYLREIIYD